MSVTVRAPAKINLTLHVGAAASGGFHALATIYQAIGLWEDVTVTDQDDWSIELSGSPAGDDIPVDGTNLAWQAGTALCAHHGLVDRAARIEISKGVPVAGGMAGGSADAAATLVALDRLWDLHTSDEDLLRIGATLGSDVPFALVGGTAVGTGRGEVVTPVTDRGEWWWVVVPDKTGLSTPAVYREFDVVRAEANAGRDGDDVPYPDEPDISSAALAALESGRPDLLADALRNDLQQPALRLRPGLRDTFRAAEATGPVATLLSGSGPTVLLLAQDALHARALRASLAKQDITSYAAPGPVAGAHVIPKD